MLTGDPFDGCEELIEEGLTEWDWDLLEAQASKQQASADAWQGWSWHFGRESLSSECTTVGAGSIGSASTCSSASPRRSLGCITSPTLADLAALERSPRDLDEAASLGYSALLGG